MLSTLKIKNLALVNDLTWHLGSNLISVTGQTGAGKSMIIGALNLILGSRSNKDVIRNGQNTCTVESIFQISTNLNQINDILIKSGLEACEDNTLIIKRIISDNSNKQFINCSPCTLSTLKQIGNLLVDLHGPHDHQSLLSTSRQLSMLDSYSKLESKKEEYLNLYKIWKKNDTKLKEFNENNFINEKEIELLQFQVDEIINSNITEKEFIEIENKYTQIKNKNKFTKLSNDLSETLNTAFNILTKVPRYFREFEEFDSNIRNQSDQFNSIFIELEEINNVMKSYNEKIDIDPNEVLKIENRIDEIETLKRKYGNTANEILNYCEKISEKLNLINNRDEIKKDLLNKVKLSYKNLKSKSEEISRIRKDNIPIICSEIESHMKDLGFLQSIFKISIETKEEPYEYGFDKIEFLFQPNPGEPIKNLKSIASSGEISRVMLAIKSALAKQDKIPLMIFDEIDANVGGEIAKSIGKKMAFLGKEHQIISITHMPQVAAQSNEHFLVKKEVKNNETYSTLEAITGEKRVNEIARMLGGINKETIALSNKLLS